ncbi:MAG: hypothetical protein WC508_03640 [Patescibacteria group bacterium]
MTRRKIIKQLKKYFEQILIDRIGSDLVFSQAICQQGFAQAVLATDLPAQLLEMSNFGQQALDSILKQASVWELRHRRAKAKRNRAKNRVAQPIQLVIKPFSGKAKRRLAARCHRESRLAQVEQSPYRLVLVSEAFIDFEVSVLHPVKHRLPVLPRRCQTRQFSIHLGKCYLGNPGQASGRYVGGLDVRVVCHWQHRKNGHQVFTFKIKSCKASNGGCVCWPRAELRLLNELPYGLLCQLHQLLSYQSPHLFPLVLAI